MGSFFSSIFSTLKSTNSKEEFSNNVNENEIIKNQEGQKGQEGQEGQECPVNEGNQDVHCNILTEAATPAATITKRKSKPELLVHRPVDYSVPPNPSANLVIHEFLWKYGGKEILLAGSFTGWKPSIVMVPGSDYWRALVELDAAKVWEFKFVVDGVWRCALDLPTVTDSQGNTNNIIYPE